MIEDFAQSRWPIQNSQSFSGEILGVDIVVKNQEFERYKEIIPPPNVVFFFPSARKDQIHPGLLHHPFLCGIGHANPSAFTEAYSNGRTGVYHCADLPMAWHLLVGLHVPWPAMASKFPQTYIVFIYNIYIYIYLPFTNVFMSLYCKGWPGANLQSSPIAKLSRLCDWVHVAERRYCRHFDHVSFFLSAYQYHRSCK